MSFFSKFFNKEKKEDLDKGLEKTKTSFLGKLSKAIAGKSTVDVEVLDELENILVSWCEDIETIEEDLTDELGIRQSVDIDSGAAETVIPFKQVRSHTEYEKRRRPSRD